VIKGFPLSMARLIDEFNKMPGIGVRSAQRMAFHVLGLPREGVDAILRCIREVKENVRFCKECNNLSEKDVCSICSDSSRDHSKICVVEGPKSVIAMEKSSIYRGLYHVLLGELSPLDGVGPEALKIPGLIQRVKTGETKEIIVATGFTTEGETTAMYLFKVLKPFKVKISRLARGVPAGSSLEFTDVATIQRAFEERRIAA